MKYGSSLKFNKLWSNKMHKYQLCKCLLPYFHNVVFLGIKRILCWSYTIILEHLFNINSRIQETLNLSTYADSSTDTKRCHVSPVICHLSQPQTLPLLTPPLCTAGCSSWPRSINNECQRTKNYLFPHGDFGLFLRQNLYIWEKCLFLTSP